MLFRSVEIEGRVSGGAVLACETVEMLGGMTVREERMGEEDRRVHRIDRRYESSCKCHAAGSEDPRFNHPFTVAATFDEAKRFLAQRTSVT